MKRVQFYLDDSTYTEAKLRSAKNGKPMAEMVREAMAEYLAKAPPVVPFGEDPMDKIAGIWKGGPPDGSTRVDEYVYGPPAVTRAEASPLRRKRRS